MTDDEGRITYWNDAAERTFGYRREEVLDQPLLDRLVPPRLHDDYRRALPIVHGTDETAGLGKIMELAAIRKNGEEFPIELSVSAFRLDDQWHAVGVMSDLSSRKWYEAELEERGAAFADAGRGRRRADTRRVGRGDASRLHVGPFPETAGPGPDLVRGPGKPGDGVEGRCGDTEVPGRRSGNNGPCPRDPSPIRRRRHRR